MRNGIAEAGATVAWRERLEWDRLLLGGLVVLAALGLLVALGLPLAQLATRSVTDAEGRFTGAANLLRYLRTPALSASLWNSMVVAIVTTGLSVALGFPYAYALTRSRMPGQGFFRAVAMLPCFAPTLLYGISLVYLFGKKGLVTTGLFGLTERWLGVPLRVDIGLYGPVGIVLAEILFAFPQVVLILSVALRLTDARLYEAAGSLRASPLRTFVTVTLPGIKYGLLGAATVAFILTFTDFGAPKVVGGNYNVLATDVYKQVIGQQNFAMGATISLVLLLPTVLAFGLDRWVQRRQFAGVRAGAVPFVPRAHSARDRLCLAYCGVVAGAIAVVFGVAILASLVRVWPYDLSLTLAQYRFQGVGGGGYRALWNSIRMSAYTAALGTVATFLAAYLIEKTRVLPPVRNLSYLLSMVPLALPGTVIGLAYILFFNAPGWQIGDWRVPNVFHSLYHSMAILVLANVVHFYTVSFLTAMTALKQLDPEFEAVSASLRVSRLLTCARVTVPVCMPAILEIALYYFVNAMATVSAVIFLYAPELPLAAVAVANMDDAGDTAAAAAMSVLIVLGNLAVRVLFGAATAGVRRRHEGWTGR